MTEFIDISKTRVSYELPNSKDTLVFGPSFWEAFHDLAHRIPCDGCRLESESFVSFWHDLKNHDLGKPLYDRSNFNMWLDKIQAVKDDRKKNNDRKILAVITAVVVATFIVILIKIKK